MKLLCFDFDGVLCDSIEQQLELIVTAHNELELGRLPTIEDIQRIENLSYLSMAERVGVPPSKVKEYGEFIHERSKLLKPEKFFPDIKKVLDSLSGKNSIAIVTSNSREAVLNSLLVNEVSLHIPIYDGFSTLNKSERILLACKEAEIDPSQTYMIGDSRSDIRYGKSVSVKTIAVSWGYQSKEYLELELPDFFAESPEDLIRILNVH
jgi:phosphoglycolate phosphatase